MQAIDIQIVQDEVTGALQKLLSVTENMRPAFDSIGTLLRARIDMGFKQGKSPTGTPWAAIKHRAGQPLRDTGRLQRSITHKADNDSVVIGTNVEYAPIHQFGLKSTINVPAHVRIINQAFGKKLPAPIKVYVSAHTKRITVKARPFLPLDGLPPGWAKSVMGVIEKHIEKAVQP